MIWVIRMSCLLFVCEVTCCHLFVCEVTCYDKLETLNNFEAHGPPCCNPCAPMCAHVRPCENWCSLIPTLFQTGSIFLTRGHLLSCKPILTSGKWVPLWWSQRIRFWFHILSLFSWWRILHILSRKMSCLHLSRSLFFNCPMCIFLHLFIFFGQIFQKCHCLICSEARSRNSIPVELSSKICCTYLESRN